MCRRLDHYDTPGSERGVVISARGSIPDLDALDPDERRLLRRAPAPEHAAVTKAVLTGERFSDPAWIFERKLDGIRCVAIRSGERVRLLSRNDLSLNARYPELATALERERCDQFAVDGEIVAFDGPRTSFSQLAQRARHHVSVFLYVFDLLWLPWSARRLPASARAVMHLATSRTIRASAISAGPSAALPLSVFHSRFDPTFPYYPPGSGINSRAEQALRCRRGSRARSSRPKIIARGFRRICAGVAADETHSQGAPCP